MQMLKLGQAAHLPLAGRQIGLLRMTQAYAHTHLNFLSAFVQQDMGMYRTNQLTSQYEIDKTRFDRRVRNIYTISFKYTASPMRYTRVVNSRR